VIHDIPFYHRDIRWNNVIRRIDDPTKWFLIDWEDAACSPTKAQVNCNLKWACTVDLLSCPQCEVSSKIDSDRASEKTHLAALKTLLQIIIAERKKANTYRSMVQCDNSAF